MKAAVAPEQQLKRDASWLFQKGRAKTGGRRKGTGNVRAIKVEDAILEAC